MAPGLNCYLLVVTICPAPRVGRLSRTVRYLGLSLGLVSSLGCGRSGFGRLAGGRSRGLLRISSLLIGRAVRLGLGPRLGRLLERGPLVVALAWSWEGGMQATHVIVELVCTLRNLELLVAGDIVEGGNHLHNCWVSLALPGTLTLVNLGVEDGIHRDVVGLLNRLEELAPGVHL